jgi:SAM-dependent methyltransferase
MLALARKNAVKFFTATGLANVEFVEGNIESLPLDDAGVDVVISNCVINLSPDKPQVFREIHRVLKPRGRMIVSDIVLNRALPESALNDAGLYAACIAGAMLRDDYLQAIRDAGFAKVEVLTDHTYQPADACDDPVTAGVSHSLAGVAASITVYAEK